jgi:hypothetical protein
VPEHPQLSTLTARLADGPPGPASDTPLALARSSSSRAIWISRSSGRGQPGSGRLPGLIVHSCHR